MCGRYVIESSASELRQLFQALSELPNFAPSWNVAPTHHAPVLRRQPDTGERRLDLLQWGFVPRFTADIATARKPINARCETAASSPMFRDALARRRCLVPADAFYEWTSVGKAKQPHAVARADGMPMALAGLWEGWRGPDGMVLRSFAIITTTACEALVDLHERMPVVLEAADWPVWLGEQPGDAQALLKPSGSTFRTWKIAARVGNVRNDDPGLLEPLTESRPDSAPMLV